MVAVAVVVRAPRLLVVARLRLAVVVPAVIIATVAVVVLAAVVRVAAIAIIAIVAAVARATRLLAVALLLPPAMRRQLSRRLPLPQLLRRPAPDRNVFSHGFPWLIQGEPKCLDELSDALYRLRSIRKSSGFQSRTSSFEVRLFLFSRDGLAVECKAVGSRSSKRP